MRACKNECRINLNLPARARKQLERIHRKTSAGSLTEVIEKALVVYELLRDREKEGFELVLRKDETEKVLIVL